MTGDKVIGSEFAQFRCDVLADFGAILASGVELAALGGIDRTGNISLQHHQFAVVVHIGGGNRGKQRQAL